MLPGSALHAASTLAESSAAPGAPNPWFSGKFYSQNSGLIVSALREHVTTTALTVLIGVLLALPLALLVRRVRWLSGPVLGVAGILYTIPSLALFAVLVPFTGLRQRTVVVGLVLYTLLILIRNIVVGLEGVPATVREAATAMGYGSVRLFWRVELPIALPAIMAGIRIATVSTIALATVGATVGFGGLGDLILSGFNNNFYRAEIAAGTIGCLLLALVADLLLLWLTRLLSPWSRGAVS